MAGFDPIWPDFEFLRLKTFIMSEIPMQRIPFKAYSNKEIARLYDVSPRTWRRWLEPFRNDIGYRKGHFYNPNQVKVIFEKLGIPDAFDDRS
jgi:hypothetical protein